MVSPTTKLGTKKRSSRNRTKERACDKAIINTLSYRSIFNSSLSYYQICTYLLCNRTFDHKFIEKRISSLLKTKKIKQKDGKYYCKIPKPYSWSLRVGYSQDLLVEAQKAFKYLEKIKWIKLLAVTGSIAANNAKKHDDIDIFIVTSKNRLWLTRFFVYLILRAVKMYPTKNTTAHKFCPNLFIDEKALKCEKENQNIYIAHDIALMIPIINREDMYFKFLHQNQWVFNYFCNYKVTFPEKFSSTIVYKNKLITKLNRYAMVFQLRYMQKAKTTEITTKHKIHFKKFDHSTRVLNEFEKVSA